MATKWSYLSNTYYQLGGILRLLANYKILSRYVPPHANLVAAAMLINEF